MTIIPEHQSRDGGAFEVSLTGGIGVVVAQWNLFKQPRDLMVEAQATISAGSFGIRIDAEVSDRITLTDATLGSADIRDLADGTHLVKIVSLEVGSTMTLFELKVLGGT